MSCRRFDFVCGLRGFVHVYIGPMYWLQHDRYVWMWRRTLRPVSSHGMRLIGYCCVGREYSSPMWQANFIQPGWTSMCCILAISDRLGTCLTNATHGKDSSAKRVADAICIKRIIERYWRSNAFVDTVCFLSIAVIAFPVIFSHRVALMVVCCFSPVLSLSRLFVGQ